MAVTIQEELSVIDKQVTDLKRSADTAAQKVRLLGEELKLDPKNVETMNDRLKALNEQVKRYTEYQDALNVKQQKLQQQLATQQSQKEKLAEDTEEYKKLEAQIQKTSEKLTSVERKIKSANNTLERLNNTTSLYNKQLAETQRQLKIDKLNSYNNALGSLQKTINKVQVALTLLITTVAKLSIETTQQATELYTLSKRYKTSAENIQQWNKALQLATGDTDLFTQSLQVMSKGLAQIAAERGVAYQKALRGIGVAYKDIQSLDPTLQFKAILNGLENVADESLRASYAITLFGESGQTIINALQEGGEALDEYKEKAKAYIAYTQEDTEALAELGFQLDDAKVKLQRATAELAINATPAIVDILNILSETALPLLTALTKHTWLLKTAFWLLIALIITKGLIAFAQLIIQIKLAAEEQKKFLMWTLAAKAAVLGFAAVVGTIATIGAAITSANSQLETFADTANQAYNAYGDDLSTNVETYATRSSTTTSIIDVTINGKGDTTVSDEAAQTVAQLTADELQKRWGDLVK